jgi:hypothetical protein
MTLPRIWLSYVPREASWSAAALCRFQPTKTGRPDATKAAHLPFYFIN